MAIPLSPLLAKLVLRLNPFSRILIVCKGYNEDYENFTELVWEDDKHLDFCEPFDFLEWDGKILKVWLNEIVIEKYYLKDLNGFCFQ